MILPVYLYASEDEESHRLIDMLGLAAKGRGITLQVRMNEHRPQQAALALKQAEQISVVLLGTGMGKQDDLQLTASLGQIAYRANRDSYLIYTADARADTDALMAVCYRPYAALTLPLDQRLAEYVIRHILDDYAHLAGEDGTQYVSFQTGGSISRVSKDSILYVEALNKKIVVYTTSAQLSVYGTILEMEEKLGGDFFRCHRSYVVARNQIAEVRMGDATIVLKGGQQIPLAKRHRTEAKEWMMSP